MVGALPVARFIIHWTASPSAVTVSPSNAAQTTVSVPAQVSAGTYSVVVTCQVTYPCIHDDGLPCSISGGSSTTVPIYTIGGPITGDNNIYWFCDSSTSTDYGYLSAASGQPAGTTYSWSISGTGAQFVGGVPTTSSATYCGAGAGSMKPGDVKATVPYSLNGVTATSDPFPITVHAPATFMIDPKGKTPPVKLIPPDPSAYGFNGQSIRFQVLDSVGLPFPPNKAYWSESWVQQAGGGQPAHVGGGPLDAQGYSVDSFDLTMLSEPSNPNGDKIWGPLTHTYSVTDSGGTGGLVGCAVQVYTNVYYYTYGVTGNGF